MQEMGYDILRNSAHAEAARAGAPGAQASFCLGAGFDDTCTRVVKREELSLG